MHKEADPRDILTQDEMQKKVLFQQCQQLALKLSKLVASTESAFRQSLKDHKEQIMRSMKLTQTGRIIMP